MESEPTVFLVDDDPTVRESLKWLIESVDLRVVTYGSAAEFIESFDPLAPGCLVLDLRMPGMSGLELQERRVAHGCGLPVIIFTGHADVPMSIRAFEGGAFAFLEKPVNQQVLLEKISKAIEQDKIDRQAAIPDGIDERIERFTPREREVMDLLVAGHPIKQIATKLQISVPTCSKHRTKPLDMLEIDKVHSGWVVTGDERRSLERSGASHQDLTMNLRRIWLSRAKHLFEHDQQTA